MTDDLEFALANQRVFIKDSVVVSVEYLLLKPDLILSSRLLCEANININLLYMVCSLRGIKLAVA